MVSGYHCTVEPGVTLSSRDVIDIDFVHFVHGCIGCCVDSRVDGISPGPHALCLPGLLVDFDGLVHSVVQCRDPRVLLHYFVT